MAQPDAVVVDLVPLAIVDIEVTTSSTESFVQTDGGFPKGPIDRSMLIGYDDHVENRLWKGEVYIFYV